MIWLRLTLMSVCLFILSFKSPEPQKRTLSWWLRFALAGYVIPSMAYTLSVLWTGYRISVSFQPFIPLFVALRTKTSMSVERSGALTLTMLGTLVIWSRISWHQELWSVWIAILASILHALSVTEWFVMLSDIRENHIAYISKGSGIAVLLMFFLLIIWNPQHLAAAYVYHIDAWFAVVIAGAVCASCKYWLVAEFSGKLAADSIAIFECIHPIATLTSDIVRDKDIFEWQDATGCFLYFCGWILYPKKNI